MYGIAIDVGTSGTRMHAVDLESKKIISTAITVRHPVPGANVMDHLTFCIEVNQDVAHQLLIDTSNKLMKMLDIDLNKVERVAICGNPIQLSMYQNMEVRDLAFAMPNALKSRGGKCGQINRRMGFLYRLQANDRLRDAIKPAAEFDGIRRPYGLQHLQELVGPGAAVLEFRSRCIKFVLGPSEPEPHHQPAAREDIERRQSTG